ncbi:tetratricopeptide repeat protein [Campylobacter mucosalis]|uniref:tetratricopeptide repeat protein n=1 Tax=Campylobacter mucosalis TaxID=202 RepID=UPI0004DA50CF|nr:tetratricopeptide repeat protein [Campylobacter mucosalis]KEA45523.1 serine protease [Campylobacter mucosalis]QKF63307.1 Sel1 domain-containing protein [Campylobacter mucosalis]
MKKILIAGLAFASLVASENYQKAQEQFMAKDYLNAYTSFNRACGEGVKKACSMNAIMLFNGDGVKKDYAQAEQIFSKMCDENEAMACSKLAEMHAYGLNKDGKKDEEKTAALFKKACDLGYTAACNVLGK